MTNESDFQRLLKGEFKPKDPTEHGRMQQAFIAERPSFVDIENIQDPATKAMIKKWDKMFPAPVQPIQTSLSDSSGEDDQRTRSWSNDVQAGKAWPFPTGSFGFLG
jgi:hypothetical protein